MLDRPISLIFGVASLAWIASIFMETTPHARLERTCAPVRWSGNIIGSIAALTSPTAVEKVAEYTDDWDYGCQFTFWRLVYGNDYANSLAKQPPTPGQPTPAPPKAPATPAGQAQSNYKQVYLPSGQLVYQLPDGQYVLPLEIGPATKEPAKPAGEAN
jgi:hypothetical protein